MDTTPNTQATQVINHKLERPTHGRVLGGVAAAIANRTGASVGMVRLAFLIAGLFGGFGVVLYLAAWALVPDEGETASAAEHWLDNLTTPGKRAGAVLIGLAALIILTGVAPITVLAAATLLAGAALLATDRQPSPTVIAEAAGSLATEETE